MSKKQRPIPSNNVGKMYLHCKRCLAELPEGQSPAEWARLNVAWTEIGLQVWCSRHNVNIIHIDFEGHKHPANLGGEPEQTATNEQTITE